MGGVPPTNAGPTNSCSALIWEMGKAGEERDWENHNIWLLDPKYMKDRKQGEKKTKFLYSFVFACHNLIALKVWLLVNDWSVSLVIWKNVLYKVQYTHAADSLSRKMNITSYIKEKSDLESHMLAEQVIQATIISRLQSHYHHCRRQFFLPAIYYRLQGVYMVWKACPLDSVFYWSRQPSWLIYSQVCLTRERNLWGKYKDAWPTSCDIWPFKLT